MYSISSIEPIQESIASRDSALAESLVSLYQTQQREYYDGEDPEEEEVEEFREYVDGMIMCESAPPREPGCWNYVIKLLAAHFNLSPTELPLEDWKHNYVWDDYKSQIDGQLDPQSGSLIDYLNDGRPLKGNSIDHDGCVFAWLTCEETKHLRDTLSKIDLPESELTEFHEQLVDSLNESIETNAILILASH